MNKTIEVIDLYEFLEYAPSSYRTTIDVELKNAADFSLVPLLVEPSDGTIRVAESAPLLVAFRANFANVTRSLNLNPNMISIESDRVEILFDQKPAIAAVAATVGVDSPRLFTTSNASSVSSSSQPSSSTTLVGGDVTKPPSSPLPVLEQFEYEKSWVIRKK